MPAPPELQRIAGGAPAIAIVATDEDGSLRNEITEILQGLGPVNQRRLQDPLLATYCDEDVELVVRPTSNKFGFVSNASERNTLFIYESAIIVGLPITLIAAYTWPWHGEVICEAEVQTLWCDEGARPASTSVLTSVHAQGTGIIAQDALREQLEPYAWTSIARELVRSAQRCGHFEKGVDRCAENGH